MSVGRLVNWLDGMSTFPKKPDKLHFNDPLRVKKDRRLEEIYNDATSDTYAATSNQFVLSFGTALLARVAGGG